jgi:hypothetical protein
MEWYRVELRWVLRYVTIHYVPRELVQGERIVDREPMIRKRKPMAPEVRERLRQIALERARKYREEQRQEQREEVGPSVRDFHIEERTDAARRRRLEEESL